jgi:hypothetical protein
LKHDACCQNIMLWPSRRSNDRVGTNLEALDMGYSYIKSCSKCDYYMQNKALHMKARILPRSHLSQMWQCTSDHKLGDVYHHGSLQTPYRPVKTTKLNSYMCSVCNISSSDSSRKQVRLVEDKVTPTITELDS